MDWQTYLFDEVKSPSVLQVVIRGALVFVAALIILRISATRLFGHGMAMDNLVVIILGGILSRVVVGASAFFPVMAATVAILILHWAVARLSVYKQLRKLLGGEKTILYKDGARRSKVMERSLTGEEDLREAMRLRVNTEDFDKVSEICMERNGEISVVNKS